jgi:mRNA interferase YafQ
LFPSLIAFTNYTDKKQGKDISLLDKIIPILLSGKKLPRKYKDHQLKGNLSKFRELHIQPD